MYRYHGLNLRRRVQVRRTAKVLLSSFTRTSIQVFIQRAEDRLHEMPGLDARDGMVHGEASGRLNCILRSNTSAGMILDVRLLVWLLRARAGCETT
jgi:hypothetical protein